MIRKIKSNTLYYKKKIIARASKVMKELTGQQGSTRNRRMMQNKGVRSEQ